MRSTRGSLRLLKAWIRSTLVLNLVAILTSVSPAGHRVVRLDHCHAGMDRALALRARVRPAHRAHHRHARADGRGLQNRSRARRRCLVSGSRWRAGTFGMVEHLQQAKTESEKRDQDRKGRDTQRVALQPRRGLATATGTPRRAGRRTIGFALFPTSTLSLMQLGFACRTRLHSQPGNSGCNPVGNSGSSTEVSAAPQIGTKLGSFTDGRFRTHA